MNVWHFIFITISNEVQGCEDFWLCILAKGRYRWCQKCRHVWWKSNFSLTENFSVVHCNKSQTPKISESHAIVHFLSWFQFFMIYRYLYVCVCVCVVLYMAFVFLLLVTVIYARCLLTGHTNMCAWFEDGVHESSLILWSVTRFCSKAHLKTKKSIFTYIWVDKTGDEYSSEVKFSGSSPSSPTILIVFQTLFVLC